MSTEKATDKQYHIRVSKRASKRLERLMGWWRVKSTSYAVQEAINAAYEQELALRQTKEQKLAEVGRMSQELREELFKLPPTGLSALGSPLSPADALQSDIRQRIANANNRPTCIHDPLGEFAFCEICDAIKLAESKGSDK